MGNARSSVEDKKMSDPFEICVCSKLTNLPEIAEFVGERAKAAGLDENQVFEVQMAIDEAATNSMQHAYEGRGNGELRVCCFIEGNAFVVRITDFGAPFDPGQVPEPDLSVPLEDRPIGGLGLYLMRRLMDDVEFQSDPTEGNQVTLRKRRQGLG